MKELLEYLASDESKEIRDKLLKGNAEPDNGHIFEYLKEKQK